MPDQSTEDSGNITDDPNNTPDTTSLPAEETTGDSGEVTTSLIGDETTENPDEATTTLPAETTTEDSG